MTNKEYFNILNGYKSEKIGFIQARGIGDIVILMPICRWFYSKGNEVHLVCDSQYIESLQYAFPFCQFHGVHDEEKNLFNNIKNPFWFEGPKEILEGIGCTKIISFPFEEIFYKDTVGKMLPQRISGEYESQALQKNITYHLTFDQFKYALAGVPFSEKWNLSIRRNLTREYDLFKHVVKHPKYAVFHTNVNNGTLNVKVEDYTPFYSMYGEDLQIIEIQKITDNVFDWLTVLEHATCIVAVDSVYVNLVDQLGFKNDKYFIQRSNVIFTPVMREKWEQVKGPVPK